MKLPGADVDRVNTARASRHQHLGKAAGRSADIKTDVSGGIEAEMRERRGEVLGNDHALASGKRVVLHDVGRPERVKRVLSLSGGTNDPRLRGRHPRGRHHVFGKGLGPFDARRRRIRPEDRDASFPQRVRDAGHQRRLRANHDEIRRDSLRQPGHVHWIVGTHRVHLRQRRDAGIARSAVQNR